MGNFRWKKANEKNFRSNLLRKIFLLKFSLVCGVSVWLYNGAAAYRHAKPELCYALEGTGTHPLITACDPGALAKTVERIISFPDDIQLYGSSDPLGYPLCRHDNGGMRIGPRDMRQDRAIDHPQAGEAKHPPGLIHHRHRV